MSYITLRGRRCDIIVLNAHAQQRKMENFYDDLKRVFDQFPEYHMENLLG